MVGRKEEHTGGILSNGRGWISVWRRRGKIDRRKKRRIE
jgi:hypothetical protein